MFQNTNVATKSTAAVKGERAVIQGQVVRVLFAPAPHTPFISTGTVNKIFSPFAANIYKMQRVIPHF